MGLANEPVQLGFGNLDTCRLSTTHSCAGHAKFKSGTAGRNRPTVVGAEVSEWLETGEECNSSLQTEKRGKN
ncbi:MAG: hypothetical protein QOI94_474 [Acidobacteriaceae bacterium]|jgi:hypothetical protein|nr:hypothetical protein [Acidobacteriaceae bacterium]